MSVTELDRAGYDTIAKKTYVVPNGVSAPEQLPVKNSAPRIIALGRLDAQKQFDHLIYAFSKVSHEFPDWTVSIFGTGPDKERLLKTAADVGLSHKIHFSGTTEDSISEIARSEICAVTSKYEGFGLVYIEAYAAKVPIVTYDIERGPKEIVIDGITGLKAKPFDIDGLAAQLRLLMASSELRATIGNAGYELYTKRYTSAIAGKLFEEALDDLTKH